MQNQVSIVSNMPGSLVVRNLDAVLPLDQKGSGDSLMSSIKITIRAFANDKYEWVRNFTVGWDIKDGYWAFGNGSMITSSATEQKVYLGYDIGDTINIAGEVLTICADHNHNIKFVGA